MMHRLSSLLSRPRIKPSNFFAEMASINMSSISKKLGLIFLLVTLTVFSVESQNIQAPVPKDLRAKINLYTQSFHSSTAEDGRSSSSVYARSVLESVIPSFVKEFLVPGVLAQYEDEVFANITSETCKRDIIHIWNALEALVLNSSLPEDYILHMIDSWGKPPSGILNGHMAVPGDFEECIGAHGKVSDTNEIRGSYCLGIFIPNFGAALYETNEVERRNSVQVTKNAKGAVSLVELMEIMVASLNTFPLLPSVGTCFPASCSIEDTSMFFTNVFRTFANESIISFLMSCQQEEKPPMGTGDYTMITVLAIICGLCVVGTVFDLMFPKTLGAAGPAKQSTAAKALRSFSVYTNTIKFLQTSVGSDNLGCLHGLRFFSMAWVVLGHTWLTIFYQFPWNGIDVHRLYKSGWTMMAVLNGTVSVDTFFVLSGALVAYGILKELDKTKWLNVPMLYIHRYLRITPTYAIVLGMMATIMPYLGNAPNWSLIESESKNCQKYWWHNLLYINTFVTYNAEEGDRMCYGESWYLAHDMIYFILAPLFVYPLWRWKWFGLSLLAAWFFQSVIHSGVLIAKDSLSPTFIPFLPNDSYMDAVYSKPWTRSAPYAIGILLGFILHNLKNNPHSFPHLPKWAAVAAWSVSTGAALAVIFGPYRYFDPANTSELGSPLSVLYGAVHRPVWAIVVAWIVFACVSGYGGPVNTFLSWKPFIPLGRLTYYIYMTSYHLQMIYAALNYHPVHYGIYPMVYQYLGHMALFLLIGFVLTVTVESPFIQLEKLLFEGIRKPPQKSNFIVNNDENHNRAEKKPEV